MEISCDPSSEMTTKAKSRMDWWHSANSMIFMFGMGLSTGIYGPSLIDLAEIYSTTPDDVAFMNSAKAVGMFLGSCVGTFFYKLMNDQILMLIAFIIYAVGTVAIPLLPSIIFLHVSGVITGMSFGISHIGSQVRLVKIWSDQKASAIQAFHTAYGIGAMIGPFVGAPFLSVREEDASSTRETQLYIPFGIFGFLYVCNALSMFAAYRCDPEPIETSKKEVQNDDKPSNKTWETLLMVLLFIYLTICINTEATFSNLISVYAVASPYLHFSKSEAAYIAGIFWATFTGGRVVSIVVAAFFNLQQLLIISHALVLCGSAVLIAFKSSEVCAWIGSAIMGLGVSSMYGTASGYVFQFFNVRHSHVSTILAASCLGIAISAYAVPPFVNEWPMFLQYYTGLGNLAHSVILIVIFQATRGREPLHEKMEAVPESRNEASPA